MSFAFAMACIIAKRFLQRKGAVIRFDPLCSVLPVRIAEIPFSEENVSRTVALFLT